MSRNNMLPSGTLKKEQDTPRREQGFLLLAAIVLIVILSLFGVAVTYIFAGEVSGSTGHLSSAQALFIAESGIEYEQRNLAQNVDWYRATSDPFDNSTTSVGQGSFTISTNLPATELRTQLNPAASATITVFAGGSTNRFPAPTGTLLIDEDFTVGTGNAAEFVTYNATTATTFTINARNVNVGGVSNSLLGATGGLHSHGAGIYPVTTLGVGLVGGASACTTIPNPFTITDHPKFLTAGTITVFHNASGVIVAEEISYSNSTVAGTTKTLLGVQRCANGTAGITAAAGDPVATIVPDVNGIGTTNNFEAEIISTGTANGAQRKAYKTVQR